MANFTERKRVREWWRESNEEVPTNRMVEAYEDKRLKAGTNGRDAGSVTDKYVASSDRKFDDLGASQGKKASPSATVESTRKLKPAKAIKEDFDFDDEALDSGDEDFEDEVPPDMEDESMEDGMEDNDIADDIQITVGGQSFKLVPVSDEMGDMDDEMNSELEGDMDMGDEMEAGEDDITHPMESKRSKKDQYDRMLDEAIAKTKSKAKKEAAQRLLKQKKVIESKLSELFTGSVVTSDGGAKPVQRGEASFAVVGQAKDGKQYTPSIPSKKTPFEPSADDVDTKSKAPNNQTIKTESSKKAAFKKWLTEMEKQLDEAEDAGKTSTDFSNNDTFANQIGEGFAEVPESVGADPDVLSKYGKTAEARKARRAQMVEEEVEDEDEDGKEMFKAKESTSKKGSKMKEEALDFKKLMRGEYK